ncbi:hypothetical protein BH11BAC2_BH11BAC2_15180 [soil metagenome]
MLMNEFCPGYFKPQTNAQVSLMERFMEFRTINGAPSRYSILRNLAKTRQHTRSVYPPNWRVA